jgi:hypothetical protein
MFPAKKGLAQFQAVGIVHDEHTYRRSTCSALSLDHQPSESKVIGPAVSPRMEEHDNVAAEKIDACQVRTLVPIAVVASQSEIARFVSTAVLPRHNVLDMMRRVKMSVGKQAILAPAPSHAPDKGPGSPDASLATVGFELLPGLEL